ncbi:MAG: PadR family transcriptional regulator [Longimicrobiales bacterium]
MAGKTDVLRGTLDLMILNALAGGRMHGYGVVRWIRRTTDEALLVEDGALYPALHRLRRRGWITADWGRSENNRRARYYALTERGRQRLASEVRAWTRFSSALWKIVDAGAGDG